MGHIYPFCVFLHEFFATLETFWRISTKHMRCWRTYCAVCPRWCYYCCWLVSTIFGILAVAGLPSAVDICDVLLYLLLLLNVLVVSFCCCCWCPRWMLLSSCGPTADDIYDDAIVPATAVIYDSCFCCHPYCVGGPGVVFIPAIACIPAVVSSHDIAVILAVACC